MNKSEHHAPGKGALLERQIGQLGKLSWLWMNSSLHREWTVDMAARFLLPPISLNQIEIIERDGMPVAYCSWAWLGEQAEVCYVLKPSEIKENDWNCGDRLWFVDWVAPFAAADSWQLRSLMAERFPDEVARAIRVKRDSTRARVMEFKGSRLPAATGRERLKRYYDDFLRAASSVASNEHIPDATAAHGTERVVPQGGSSG